MNAAGKVVSNSTNKIHQTSELPFNRALLLCYPSACRGRIHVHNFVLQVNFSDVEVDVDRIFTRLDTNDDGVVTIEEFIESCQTVGAY